jgi:hypothetical protein
MIYNLHMVYKTKNQPKLNNWLSILNYRVIKRKRTKWQVDGYHSCNKNPIKFRVISLISHLILGLLSTNLAHNFIPHQQLASIQGGKQHKQ